MDKTQSRFLVLFLVALLCLNALYWGIQAVNMAEADDLAMLSTPPVGFTPLEVRVLEEGYRHLEREADRFMREDGDRPGRLYEDDDDIDFMDYYHPEEIQQSYQQVYKARQDDDPVKEYMVNPEGQSREEFMLELAIDRIIYGYPIRILDVDHPRKYLIIEISGWMTAGTDINCEQAMEVFHRLTGLGLTLEVRGEWVPSRENPMTHAWTTQVVESDGRVQI